MYMSDLLLQDGDLVVDKYDDIMLCTDENSDIIQTVNMSILLRLGGNKFHEDLGNNAYNRRIKASQNGLEVIRSECIDAIMKSDARVREIRQIDVELGEDASCIVNYVITYINENEELTQTDGRTYIDAFNMKGGE
jgi:hypothetical protein